MQKMVLLTFLSILGGFSPLVFGYSVQVRMILNPGSNLVAGGSNKTVAITGGKVVSGGGFTSLQIGEVTGQAITLNPGSNSLVSQMPADIIQIGTAFSDGSYLGTVSNSIGVSSTSTGCSFPPGAKKAVPQGSWTATSSNIGWVQFCDEGNGTVAVASTMTMACFSAPTCMGGGIGAVYPANFDGSGKLAFLGT